MLTRKSSNRNRLIADKYHRDRTLLADNSIQCVKIRYQFQYETNMCEINGQVAKCAT